MFKWNLSFIYKKSMRRGEMYSAKALKPIEKNCKYKFSKCWKEDCLFFAIRDQTGKQIQSLIFHIIYLFILYQHAKNWILS